MITLATCFAVTVCIVSVTDTDFFRLVLRFVFSLGLGPDFGEFHESRGSAAARRQQERPPDQEAGSSPVMGTNRRGVTGR